MAAKDTKAGLYYIYLLVGHKKSITTTAATRLGLLMLRHFLEYMEGNKL
jgi:hypothetical protein